MSGSSLVAQNGRECVLRPGEFAVYESIKPYSLLFDEGVDHHFLRFPRAALALPDRLLRDTGTVTLGSDNPVAGLAFTYFSRLAVSDALREGTHADAVVQPSVELLRAVLTTQHGNSSMSRGPLEATLGLRITQYMSDHLSDPDLSPARIAAAHDISDATSTPYSPARASASATGSAPAAWPRADENWPDRTAGKTIAAVGRSWGFVNATHFSKAFRQAYGITPREWRDQNRP